MKYSVTRKINLGRFGLQFESIDIGVSDCETKKEAMDEIGVWKRKIEAAIIDAKAKTKKDDLPF